jgi:hypothetical protein
VTRDDDDDDNNNNNNNNNKQGTENVGIRETSKRENAKNQMRYF